MDVSMFGLFDLTRPEPRCIVPVQAVQALIANDNAATGAVAPRQAAPPHRRRPGRSLFLHVFARRRDAEPA